MKEILTILIFLSFIFSGIAQNVGIGTNTPAASAQLDVSSTTQGILLPRMTTAQKNAIANPAEGLEVYDLTLHQKSYYNGSGWVSLTTPTTTAVFLPTIVIGTQQWMSKNLDVAFYRNGDLIPQVNDPLEWVSLSTGAWCYYDNDSTQGTTFGKLYNWYAVNDPRGLAPAGWHIPSDLEWYALINTLGGNTLESDSIASGQMKEAGTTHWASPNTAGNNNSGFTALPGGYRDIGGGFSGVGNYGWWWSARDLSIPPNPNIASSIGLSYTNTFLIGNISSGPTDKRAGFSIRCLRD